MSDLASFDGVIFGAFPYVAVALCIWGTVARFRYRPWSVTSGSSQFLENRRHFWAVVPFHYGILAVLAGHLVAFALPRSILAWNAVPLRLYVLEAAGFVAGLLTLVGFTAAVVRRLTVASVRATTAPADWAVYALLFLQVASGVFVAVAYPWGSSWSAVVAAPYLQSLVLLRPEVAAIAALPFAIKLHVAGAFVLTAVFPFSRLVHVIDVPNRYFWRRPQVVRWIGPRPGGVEA